MASVHEQTIPPKVSPRRRKPVRRTSAGQRVHDPKRFGSIPGVKVGDWWETREECSAAAVHAPWLAGIAGTAAAGAYSIAISGGYPDDEDFGYTFTYTGAGGREQNKSHLKTGPQSYDQSFDFPMNAALKLSAATRKPIRVIRGYKLQSVYAPRSGYRYDGLYIVQRAWMERGKEGFMVCRYEFRRLDGQPPLGISTSSARVVETNSREAKLGSKQQGECDEAAVKGEIREEGKAAVKEEVVEVVKVENLSV